MSLNFHSDLKQGQSVENEVQTLLESYGLNVTTTQSQQLFEGYDLIVTSQKSTSYIEVKEDKIADHTGNVAIEVSKQNFDGTISNSGLSVTKATHVIYKITGRVDNRFYSIPVPTLKRLISTLESNGLLKTVWGGDNNKSQLVLLPLILFRKNSKHLTINAH